jgi:hypothetical protein
VPFPCRFECTKLLDRFLIASAPCTCGQCAALRTFECDCTKKTHYTWAGTCRWYAVGRNVWESGRGGERRTRGCACSRAPGPVRRERRGQCELRHGRVKERKRSGRIRRGKERVAFGTREARHPRRSAHALWCAEAHTHNTCALRHPRLVCVGSADGYARTPNTQRACPCARVQIFVPARRQTGRSRVGAGH